MKKRNLQRIFAAFMATAMVVGVTACSDKNEDTKPTDTPSTTDAPTTEPTRKLTSLPMHLKLPMHL